MTLPGPGGVPADPPAPPPPATMLTAQGTARRIDALGRVVVPAEMRKLLGIREGDLLDIHLDEHRIVMARIEHNCLFCGATDDLRTYRDRLVCVRCAAEVGDTA